MELMDLTATELGKKIKDGEITVLEAVEQALCEIQKKEESIHSYITVFEEDELRERAREVQRQIEEGKLTGAFAGVPVAVKDNICKKGALTTCGSHMLENFYPPYSADAVINIEKAGAIVIGKTNMDEFAMGNTTEISIFGATHNPHNTDYVAGGSSGGSCAAVAAGECSFALGSDTGGSIRQPSSFCGVVGMKPTYGTVSRYGLIAHASSLEQIGPITKDVTDCAYAMEILASYDAKDSTSIKREDTDFSSALIEDVKGMRIGIVREYFDDGLAKEVREKVLQVAEDLRQRGAIVEELELGDISAAVPAYYVIASAEASSNLSRFDGVKYGYRTDEYEGLHDMYKKTRAEGFGREVKRRIMLGSFVLSSRYYDAYYRKALGARMLIKEQFDKAFSSYDLILAPTAPTTAPKIGGFWDEPVKNYSGDIYTVAANLAGLPAMSVPCGKDEKGLPIGVQFIGNYFQEKKIIQAAYTYEKGRGKI